MVLSFFKRQINFYSKNRRKILAVGICCSILICAVFREMNDVTCCTEKRNTDYTNRGQGRSNFTTTRIPATCASTRQNEIDCRKLAMGYREELQKVTIFIKHNQTEYKCQLINLVENCTALKMAHNYITDVKTILAEELEFPLAFAIKMHKSPEQAEQLLRAIYRPHNVYCVYVDKKSKLDIYHLMKKLGNCFDNVFIAEKRINVVYSSINLVEAELECMRTLTRSNKTWRYYINLTGQEFPLKTNYEIVKILQNLNGANDIESYDFPFTMQQRYTKQHVIKGNAIIKTNKLKHSFIKKFQMSKGCAYGTFSRSFVEFILSDDIAGQFLNWLNGSYAPEESAWATLNSLPWAPGGYPRETRHSSNSFLSRAIMWSWDGLKCRGRYVRGICVYGSGDLPWLVSRSELFANKFDVDRDPVVINCLEEVLRNRTKDNKLENLNWNFYNTLPHVEYYSRVKTIQQSKEYLQRKKAIWLRHHNLTVS